jgi:hypothetical protein
MYMPKTLAPNQFNILLFRRMWNEMKIMAVQNDNSAIWLLIKGWGKIFILARSKMMMLRNAPHSVKDFLLTQISTLSLYVERNAPNGNASIVFIQ